MIYVQKHNEKNIPHNFDAACAIYGALDCGQDFRYVDFDEIKYGTYDTLISKSVFIGSSDFMQKVFARMGKTPKLPKNSDRDEVIMNIDQVIDYVNVTGPIFAKSVQNKLISGMVFDSMSLSMLKREPGETPMITSKPFDKRILSETRCYIRRSEIVDARNYAGDFRIQPDWKFVENIVRNNRAEFPDVYVTDIAVLEDNENVVVEYNDMWAIGNYGIDNCEYYKLLRERYFEIMRS